MKKNEIILEINIKYINSRERIINSFENIREDQALTRKEKGGKENEKDIKDCEIYINDKKIDFTYFYTFKKKGVYKIKYKFKNLLKSTSFMFYDCKYLSSLDLSNFNTQNITNMEYMFSHCHSLSSLDISNFNTQNVTNMKSMYILIIIRFI